MIKHLWLIPFGFALLLIESIIGTLIPLFGFAPNLLLPIVIYLGVTHEIHIVRGAAIAFVLGFLYDSMSGNPMGLQTLMLVSVFVLCRFAGLRLFLRGPFFQIGLTFAVAMLHSGAILALRAIFEAPAPFAALSGVDTFVDTLIPALITAALSPFVFRAVRTFDTEPGRPQGDVASAV